MAGHIRVAFEVNEIEQTVTRLLSHGGKQIASPRLTPFGSINARLDGLADLQLTLFQTQKASD